MKTFINQIRLLKAVEYVGKNIFSIPYSITPIIDKWYNQHARIELNNGEIIDVGDHNYRYIDVVLKDEIISPQNIDLLYKYKSRNSKVDKVRAELEGNVNTLKAQILVQQILVQQNMLKESPDASAIAAFEKLITTLIETEKRLTEEFNKLGAASDDELKDKLAEKINKLKEQILVLGNMQKNIPDAKTAFASLTTRLIEEEQRATKELAELDANKEKATKLYNDIIAGGAKSIINEQRLLEAEEERLREEASDQDKEVDIPEGGLKIKKIIYRPNHDLNHSVRAAYYITAIHAFRTEQNVHYTNLDEANLEKLQMMMLFSVVGRKDETGFSDTGSNPLGHQTYEGFRSTSGREYLKYFQANKKLYGDDLELLFRDALIVELMGYSDIADVLGRKKSVPGVFIDYVIAKELSKGKNIKPEDAITLITNKIYTIGDLFPVGPVRALGDSKLKMMQQAHALDLIRCYSLTVDYDKEAVGSANLIGTFNSYLVHTQFFTPDAPDPQKLTAFNKMLYCGFESMSVTGESTCFGFLSPTEFEKQKTELLKKITAVFDKFKIPPGNKEALTKEGREKSEEIDFYFGKQERTDAEVFAHYRQYCIVKETAHCFTRDVSALPLTKKVFAYQHTLENDPHKVDYYKSAASIVQGMQAITPVSGVTPISAQIIPLVTHGRGADGTLDGKITAVFDSREQAVQFMETCTEIVGMTPDIKAGDKTFSVLVDTKHYDQLIGDGLVEQRLPVISATLHERDAHDKLTGKVTAIFDDPKQAGHFKHTYMDQFVGVAPPDITLKEGKYHVQVDRKNYKKLVKDMLVEFKLVTIPKEVTREDALIDEDGTVEALNLVIRNRAVVRLMSTSALRGEDFPDYEYYLNSLEDPITEKNRYAPLPGKDASHDRYSHTHTGEIYQRTISDTPMPAVRFQEPVDRPLRLKDKVEDGWIVGAPSGDRNTKYAKKSSHSLLPSHGKMIPFEGYPDLAANYFPIGVLSDRELVDMKDERFVWATNMGTWTRFWLTDQTSANRQLYEACGGRWDPDNKAIVRHASGEVVIAKNPCDNIKKIRRYLNGYEDSNGNPKEGKVAKIIALLDAKYYRPTKEVLEEIKRLITKERDNFLALNTIKNNPNAQDEIKQLYEGLFDRLDLEAARQHSKYAITIRELIKHQEKSTEAEEHNELLVSNTKEAVRSLYATQDTLMDRLNLVFQALKIKEKYHYDVPLLITDQTKAPYRYTEAMIKADLQEAYKGLRAGTFPYDKTLVDVYIQDEETNEKVVKTDERGENVQEPKNLAFQQRVLLDLFKLGMPKLESLDQLVQGDISGEKLDTPKIDSGVDSIIIRIDILGGLARETKLMKKVLAENNTANKEKFFLRAAALGHKTIVEHICSSGLLPFSDSLLAKAIQFADKNNHVDTNSHHELVDYLTLLKREKNALEATLADLQKPIDLSVQGDDLVNVHKERLVAIADLKKRYLALNSKLVIPELGVHIEKVATETVQHAEKNALEVKLAELQRPISASIQGDDLVIAHKERLMAMADINKRYVTLNSKLVLPELGALIQKVTSEIYLNLKSRNEANNAVLPKFIALLDSQPEYVHQYANILVANQEVKLDQLIEADNRYRAVDKESRVVYVSRLMTIIAEKSWEQNNALLKEENELVEKLNNLTKPDNGAELLSIINTFEEIDRRFTALKSQLSVPMPVLDALIKQKIAETCLNQESRSDANKAALPQFMKSLKANAYYADSYISILSSKREFNLTVLDELINLKMPTNKDPSINEDHFKKLLNTLYATRAIFRKRGYAYELEGLFNKVREVTCLNSESSHEKKRKNLDIYINHHLGENPEYVAPYARILANNMMVKLDQLLEAHERLVVQGAHELRELKCGDKEIEAYQKQAKEHIVHAMSLAADVGWEVANNYLVLLEVGATDKAEMYFKGSGFIKKDEIESLRNDCLKSIDKIQKESWGPADQQTVDYCKAMRALISHSDNKDNFYFLSYQLQQLKEVEKAVTSEEMQAVRGEYQRIQKNAESLFTSGNTKKAANISAAVCQVPLKDRLHIFSNEKKPECNEVRKALAAHRIRLTSALNSRGNVVESKAAESFKRLNKKYPNADIAPESNKYTQGFFSKPSGTEVKPLLENTIKKGIN
jgi:hypothetical protein